MKFTLWLFLLSFLQKTVIGLVSDTKVWSALLFQKTSKVLLLLIQPRTKRPFKNTMKCKNTTLTHQCV